ncbi:MAG: antibiotic biosynthesis monooxygenase [Alphaproteobacteria bacterium]|nr:antibiotic biosynthesis monooxygenase [Alphaproteobacteria bacterium]
MTILVSGVVEIDPARRDEALRSAQPFIDGALSQKGCRHYAWTADLSKPGRVYVFEEWDSEADFAAHLAGPQYRGMLGHLQQFTILSAVTRKHRVTLTEPVYDDTGRPRADFFTG